MNLPAIVALIGLLVLAANELVNVLNARWFEQGKTDFKGAVALKARSRNIVLGVSLVCAALSVYSSIADKADSDAEVKGLKDHLQKIESKVGAMAAAASAASAASSTNAADQQAAQLKDQLRQLEAGTARRAELQELRSDLKGVSSRLDVVETMLKRQEK